MLGPIRYKLNLKSRRPRPKFLEVAFNYPDGSLVTKKIPPDEFPSICTGFRWPGPGILHDRPPTNVFTGEIVIRYVNEEVRRYATENQAIRITRAPPLDFSRMLAKIAHAYAVAKCGLDTFSPSLLD
jgi:hypothetical protein